MIVKGSAFLVRNCTYAALMAWSLAGMSCGKDQSGRVVRPDGVTALGPSMPSPAADCEELLERVAVALDGLRASEGAPRRGISLQYRPALLSACLASSEDTPLGDTALADVAIGLGTADAYVLRLPRNGFVNGHPVDETFLEYMQVRSAVDLVEVVNGDSVECSFVHVESSPSIGPHHTVLLAFDHAQDDGDRKVCWRDREGRLGGDMVFSYDHGVFERYQALISSSLAATHAKR